MKFVTLQLRYRRKNPWPKLYVCREGEYAHLLRGLPCALIIRPDDMPDEWTRLMSNQTIEEMGVRGIKRGDCHDAFDKNEEAPSAIAFIERELGVTWEEVVLLVPVFQQYLKWKPSDTPDAIDASPDIVRTMWLRDKMAKNAVEVLAKVGPPMKLPNGDVIESCCAACTYVFENMIGRCQFGEETCAERMDFPGKSMLLQNLKKYVDHREVMAMKDTQPDMPAFGHDDKG